MFKKGNSQVWIISIVSIVAVILFGYFVGVLLGLWSIGGTGVSCDITTTKIVSETSEGIWLELVASGCYGGKTSSFSKIENFTYRFQTKPNKATDYDFIKKIDGNFALSTEEFNSDEAKIDATLERNVWSNNLCYGDWARTGQQVSGIATCKAKSEGVPSNPNLEDRNNLDTIALDCQIQAPFGDVGYQCSEKIFDINSASIKIFIPYSNIECLDDSMCAENYTCSDNVCDLVFSESEGNLETLSQDLNSEANPDFNANEENETEELSWWENFVNILKNLFRNWSLF